MINKKLIILLLLLLLTIFGCVVAFRMIGSQDDEDNTNTDTIQVETARLNTIIPELPSISQEDINTMIMGVIRMNVPEPKSSYNAVYRDSSFERSQSATGAPIVTFLVDVPDLQRTFRIEIEGNDETKSKTIYALCPLPGQSAYGEKACNDTP